MLSLSMPQEGELLYSWLARAFKHYGFVPDDRDGLRFFLKSERLALADLEHGSTILAAAKLLSPELSLKELVFRHTLAPLMILYSGGLQDQPTELTEAYLIECLSRYRMNSLMPVALWKLGVPCFTAFKYCPLCFAEQKAQCGFTYWRREWFPHMVVYCPKHKRRLNIANIPVLKRSRSLLFVTPDDVELTEEVATILYDRPVFHGFRDDFPKAAELRRRDLFVAHNTAKLLNCCPHKIPSVSQWLAFYLIRAHQKGLKLIPKKSFDFVDSPSEITTEELSNLYNRVIVTGLAADKYDCYFERKWSMIMNVAHTRSQTREPHFYIQYMGKWFPHMMLLEFLKENLCREEIYALLWQALATHYSDVRKLEKRLSKSARRSATTMKQ